MARTPREVLQSLFQRAIYYNLITSIFEQGRIGLMFSTLAAEFQLWETIIEAYYNQFNLITATVEEAIINIAAPLYARHPATPSKVILKFTKTGDINESDIHLPIGTRVETTGSNPIQYITIEDAYLYEGQEWTKVLARSVDYSADSHVWAEEISIMVSDIDGVEVINEQDAWGGKDDEPVETVRNRALGVRPELERGTPLALRNAMKDYGLENYEFHISEYYYNNGTLGVWIDTLSDEVLEEVSTLLNRERGAGIYCITEKATRLYMPFSIQVQLAMDHDILPQQRDRLRLEIKQAFIEFVEQNGVGENLVLKKGEHFIIQKLINFYEIYDLNITSDVVSTRQDEYGSIQISDYEVIKPESVSVTIEV